MVLWQWKTLMLISIYKLSYKFMVLSKVLQNIINTPTIIYLKIQVY